MGPTRRSTPAVAAAASARSGRRLRALVIAVAAVVAPAWLLVGGAPPASGTATARPTSAATAYPAGTSDGESPSGEAPPSATAMPGYQQTNVIDFNGSTLPRNWSAFSGPAGGDPGSAFSPAHVTVRGGLLRLNAWRDPADDDAWVTGGVCQCGIDRTYGAYFVRSRVTGPGPTEVELLWPKVGWPPEVDFNETDGTVSRTMATVHFTSQNDEVHRLLSIDMARWHTWGVVWTPTSITYTVDGRKWGSITVPSEVPHTEMTLDLTQQTWCESGFACPTADESTYINWVAEYTKVATRSVTVTPFSWDSALLNGAATGSVAVLAHDVRTDHDRVVRLTGYTDTAVPAVARAALSLAMADAVQAALQADLSSLGVTGVTVTAAGGGSANPVASNSTPDGRARNRRVVATIS